MGDMNLTSKGDTTHNALKAITLQNQTLSPLLRLPAEIRNQIYGYVFFNTQIKICRETHSELDHGTVLSNPHAHYPRRHLHLLEVCQQTHKEVRLLVFELNEMCGGRSPIERFLELGWWGGWKSMLTEDQVSAIRVVGFSVQSYDLDSSLRDLRRILRLSGLERIVVRVNRLRWDQKSNALLNASMSRVQPKVEDATRQEGRHVDVTVIEQRVLGRRR